jgi:hypothetical protein
MLFTNKDYLSLIWFLILLRDGFQPSSVLRSQLWALHVLCGNTDSLLSKYSNMKLNAIYYQNQQATSCHKTYQITLLWPNPGDGEPIMSTPDWMRIILIYCMLSGYKCRPFLTKSKSVFSKTPLRYHSSLRLLVKILFMMF